MAPVYSSQFHAGYHSTLGTTTLFTVPSGLVYVVRTITVAVFSSGTNAGYLYIPGTALLEGWNGLPVLVPKVTNQRQVLTAGQVVDLMLDSSDVFLLISGYSLTLP